MKYYSPLKKRNFDKYFNMTDPEKPYVKQTKQARHKGTNTLVPFT
jgi:hypothetical protein